jgi:hypothetical protein
VNSPVQELARSLATYITNKEIKDLVKVTASLSIDIPPITMISTSVIIG